MTEAEWFCCTDPTPILELVRGGGVVSDRKLLLFGVACCRRVWQGIRDQRFHQAITVAEHFADGRASPEERTDSREAAWEAWTEPGGRFPADTAAVDLVNENTFEAASQSAKHAAWATANCPRAEERKAQASLLRCILGPRQFRPLPVFDPFVLGWNNGTVVRLAQTIYEERDVPSGRLNNAWLAVLADALEEAGCANPDILEHCREQGRIHVRGCWAVDALLGKG
jgi:hypothetical protein